MFYTHTEFIIIQVQSNQYLLYSISTHTLYIMKSHTHIGSYVCIYTHIYARSHTHRCICIWIWTHTHICTHTHMHSHNLYTHMCMLHDYIRTRTYIYAHTRAYIHIYIQSVICMHTYNCTCICIYNSLKHIYVHIQTLKNAHTRLHAFTHTMQTRIYMCTFIIRLHECTHIHHVCIP